MTAPSSLVSHIGLTKLLLNFLPHVILTYFPSHSNLTCSTRGTAKFSFRKIICDTRRSTTPDFEELSSSLCKLGFQARYTAHHPRFCCTKSCWIPCRILIALCAVGSLRFECMLIHRVSWISFRARLLTDKSPPRSLRTSVSKKACRSCAFKPTGTCSISYSSLPIADKLHPSGNLQLVA